MQTIAVRTTQNVLIDYPIAGLYDRMMATLLDCILFTVYLIVAFSFTSSLGIQGSFVVFIIIMPVFLYNLLFEVLMNGQSPGKRVLGIRVVRLDGKSPTLGNYILRWIIWPVDFILFGSIAMACITLTRQHQRIGDLPAGTTVIMLSRKGATRTQEIIQTLEPDYEPQFPQVIHLSDRDVALIKESLAVYKVLGNTAPMESVGEKVRALFGIQTDIPVLTFLNTVVKDYHHLTSAA